MRNWRTAGAATTAWDPEPAGEIEEYDATEITQKILSGVVRTGQRFGMAHVVAVLRGSRAKRVLEFGHDRLSVHGIARDRREEELRDTADELVARNLLRRAGDSGFPTMSLTPTGWAFLRNRESLTLTRPKAAPPDKESRDSAAPHREAARSEAPAPDPALFEKLRALRLAVAREEGLPAFMVFSNATLHEMAARRPPSAAELARLRGVRPGEDREVRRPLSRRRAGLPPGGPGPRSTGSVPAGGVPPGTAEKGPPPSW